VTRWGEDGCDETTADWVQFNVIDRLINHGSTESLNLKEQMVELSGCARENHEESTRSCLKVLAWIKTIIQ
jgi:hypothetical protein